MERNAAAVKRRKTLTTHASIFRDISCRLDAMETRVERSGENHHNNAMRLLHHQFQVEELEKRMDNMAEGIKQIALKLFKENDFKLEL